MLHVICFLLYEGFMAIIPGEQKIGTVFESPQQQKQKKMIYLLVLIVLLVAAIIYFGFFRGGTPSVELPAGPGALGGPLVTPAVETGSGAANFFESLKVINLDSPLFKDKKFQGLNLFGEFPISQGTKGRENPFEPY